MTTTFTPDSEQVQAESEEWPTLASGLADTTRVDRAGWFAPTQGRTIGLGPYDDPAQGRKLGLTLRRPHPQGRKLGSDPDDDPTRAR